VLIEPVAKVALRSGARTQIPWPAGCCIRSGAVRASRISSVWTHRARIHRCLPQRWPCLRSPLKLLICPALLLPLVLSPARLCPWVLVPGRGRVRRRRGTRRALVLPAGPTGGHTQRRGHHGQSRAPQPSRIVCPAHLVLPVPPFTVMRPALVPVFVVGAGECFHLIQHLGVAIQVLQIVHYGCLR